MRIKFHPIMGEMGKKNEITVYFEDQRLTAYEEECIAAALMANGIRAFRKTRKRGDCRGYFCGIGRCTDCIMIVDGRPNVRTCVAPVREGMKIKKQVGLGNWEI